MRGESGVTGEERVVGVPKFHSWDKCTMPLTNRLDVRRFLCITLYADPLFHILGCNNVLIIKDVISVEKTLKYMLN